VPRIHSSGSRGEPHTMTDSETWKRAEDLYHAALEQEEERRRLPGTGVRRGRDAAAGGEVASGIRPDCQALPGVASGRSGHTGTEVRGCWRRAAPVALRDRVPASVRGDGRGLPVRRTCSTSASARPRRKASARPRDPPRRRVRRELGRAGELGLSGLLSVTPGPHGGDRSVWHGLAPAAVSVDSHAKPATDDRAQGLGVLRTPEVPREERTNASLFPGGALPPIQFPIRRFERPVEQAKPIPPRHRLPARRLVALGRQAVAQEQKKTNCQ